MKLFEDSDDEINDFINTQLDDVHQARADDPQLDWRTQTQTQSSIEEDDILTDPDETVNVDREFRIPKALVSAELASQSKPPLNLKDIKVYATYFDFLEHLCDQTGTNTVKHYIKDGLKHALRRARSITIDADLSANSELDTHGFALVVHVWQVLYLRVHYGLFPDQFRADRCCSTLRSATFCSRSRVPVAESCCWISNWTWKREMWALDASISVCDDMKKIRLSPERITAR